MALPTTVTALSTGHTIAHDGLYDVKAHFSGAADGVTDDTTAIQAALTAAGAASGGVVYLQPGIWITTAALTIPTAVVVRGAGINSTRIRSTSATADIFSSTSTTMIAVEDLQIEKNIATSAGSGFNFTSVSYFRLTNIRLLPTYNAGTFTSCTPGQLENITLASGSGSSWHRGFFFQLCVSIHWDGCFINGGSTLLGGSQAWIQVDSGCDTFVANDIEAGSSSGGGLCIWLTHTLSPSSFAPRWIRFNKFLVEGSNGTASFAGAQIAIRIDDARSAYFTDGYVASSAVGIAAFAGNDLKFGRVEAINCDQQGIYISGPNVVGIHDCTVSDNSQEATNTYAGITVGGTSSGVNIVGGYFGDRIVGQTKKMKYGIENAAADTRLDGTQVYENIATSNVSGTFRGIVAAPAALATNTTRGFLYIPTCAGTPSGVPTTQTGTVPLIYDTTNHKLYIYDGGAWKGGTSPGAFT